MESFGGRLVVKFGKVKLSYKVYGFQNWGANFTVHPIFWNFLTIPFLIGWWRLVVYFYRMVVKIEKFISFSKSWIAPRILEFFKNSF